MARQQQIPSLRRHKPSARAVVTVNDHDHYLGPWPDGEKDPPPAIQELYDRLIGIWLANGRKLPPGAEVVPVAPTPPQPAIVQAKAPDIVVGQVESVPAFTVNELILRYIRWARDYYRHTDGTPTDELGNVKDAARPLRALYGGTDPDKFTASDLRAIQAYLIEQGRLCRGTINQRVARIRRLFKWGVCHDLVSADVHTKLTTIPPLKEGRTKAREAEPVKPVSVEVVKATLPHLSGPVAGMVQVQLYSGARAGELTVMRPGDIDMRYPTWGPVWEYKPFRHKGTWRKKSRVIYLGPKAQEVLLPFLPATCPLCGLCDRRSKLGWRGTLCGPCADRMDEAGIEGPFPAAPVPEEWQTRHVFRPCEATAELRARQRKERKSKVQPSQKCRAKKGNLKRKPGEKYTTRSYTRSIARVCKRVGIEPWSTHQLRHAAATLIRKRYGTEAARVVLGHDKAMTTEVYAEKDMEAAARIAGDLG